MHLVRHREVVEALARVPPAMPERICARHGRRAADRCRGARRRPSMAGSDRDQAAARCLRHCRRCRHLPPPMLKRRSRMRTRCSRRARPSCSRSCRAISCISPMSAASYSTSPAPTRCARPPPRFSRARRSLRPEARISGVMVQAMVLRAKARELILGLADDPTFGTVVVFGRGGTAVEIINDKALALPPLDLQLARDLIERTRVSRLLRGLSRRAGGEAGRRRDGSGQAGADGSRHSRNPRARHQSVAGR